MPAIFTAKFRTSWFCNFKGFIAIQTIINGLYLIFPPLNNMKFFLTFLAAKYFPLNICGEFLIADQTISLFNKSVFLNKLAGTLLIAKFFTPMKGVKSFMAIGAI